MPNNADDVIVPLLPNGESYLSNEEIAQIWEQELNRSGYPPAGTDEWYEAYYRRRVLERDVAVTRQRLNRLREVLQTETPDMTRRVRRNLDTSSIPRFSLPPTAPVEESVYPFLKTKPKVAKDKKVPENELTVLKAFHPMSPQSAPRELREEMLLSMAPDAFPYDHCIGLEIEIEGARLGADVEANRLIAEAFEVRRDGSLRNGVEYVSRYGLTAGDVLTYLPVLHKLFETGKLAEGFNSFSFRCGLHVHIDVTGHTMEELYKAILLYTAVERILFAISGNRWENKFCKSVQESMSVVPNMLHYGHAGMWQHFADSVFNATKYMAMNVKPVRRMGTIEFRHHEGTSDPKRIRDWLLVLMDIVVGSKKLYTVQLEKRILELNTDSKYLAFLSECFPNSQHLLKQVKGNEKMIYRGIQFIKESFAAEPEEFKGQERD
jgi:hypothetical protein